MNWRLSPKTSQPDDISRCGRRITTHSQYHNCISVDSQHCVSSDDKGEENATQDRT